MKFSQYNVNLEMEYGLLVYNTNTTEVMKIKKAELVEHYNDLLASDNLSLEDQLTKVLYDKKFIIDDNIDEFEEAKKYQYSLIERKNKELNILIHVTDNCNFRCVYCFKKAQPKNLSDENWENLYLYLKKSFEANKFKSVSLDFYGGEPLLRYNKIVEFMKKVNNLIKLYPEIKLKYSMTTNGFLLTKEKYDTLVSLGLSFFQVTLDGFEETHNKMRPQVDGSGSWTKIIENLRYVNSVEDKTIIAVRTNFNKINKQEIDEFNVWLKEQFQNEKFYFTKVPVTKYSEEVCDDLVLDRYDDFAQKQCSDELKEDALFALRSHGMVCRNTNKNNFTLSTSGKISYCEEVDDENTIIAELVDGGDINYRVPYETWCTRLEVEECKTCVVYPLCLARSCSKVRKCGIVLADFENIKKNIKLGKVFD